MAVQREWFEKDYYATLGVSPTAQQKDITTAYRRLARQYHPDANPGDAEAEDRFKEVSAAYDVIGDAERRAEYDQVRAMGPSMGGSMGGPGGFGRPGDPGFSSADLGDLLGNLFGRGQQNAGSSGRGPFSRGPQRGQDLETDLHLSFMDSIRGITTSVNLVSDATCPDCNGQGTAPGTGPRVCPDCAGRGVIEDNQGFFAMSRPCAGCAGRGSIIDSPCPTCAGGGIVSRPRAVRVKLPQGVRDGQQVRLKGKGGPGRNGGPAGDLYVRVHVQPDTTFNREGDDLIVKVPVGFAELALGADIRVPTLDGDPVTIRIPAGTPNGRVFRVANRGVETPKGRGALLAAVEVVIPTNMSAVERAALEKYRDASTFDPREHLGV